MLNAKDYESSLEQIKKLENHIEFIEDYIKKCISLYTCFIETKKYNDKIYAVSHKREKNDEKKSSKKKIKRINTKTKR